MVEKQQLLSREKLIGIVRARSFSSGTNVKLASGRASSFYFNMKPTMLDPEGARTIAEMSLAMIADEAVDYVGGLEMGAVPLAASLAVLGAERGRPVSAFFVRKQAKEHGTQKIVEGLVEGESMAGKRVVVLEDVTTTGGSAIKAAEALRTDGAEIVMVLTVVDREEGATEAFAAADLRFEALLTASMFKQD
ncbi:MAG: orotate phosphoribosyltransferase [Pseudomonadota bacterium]